MGLLFSESVSVSSISASSSFVSLCPESKWRAPQLLNYSSKKAIQVLLSPQSKSKASMALRIDAAALSATATVSSLTATERQVLDGVRTGAAALSLGGSAFIVVCYVVFKELHKFSFKLVFFLALSDMLCSFFTIVGDPSTDFFCHAHDYSAQFFCVASFLWTTTIAFTLHRTVVNHKTDVDEFGSIFHLYVWGTALAMSILRTIGSDYGKPGIGCWIQPPTTGKARLLPLHFPPLHLLPISPSNRSM